MANHKKYSNMPSYAADPNGYARKWRKLNPHRHYLAQIKYKLGISEEEYERLYEAQQGLCAICNAPETAQWNGKIRKLAVDHCHTTNTVRGLLCTKCNNLLGLCRDSLEVLARAMNYLFKEKLNDQD